MRNKKILIFVTILFIIVFLIIFRVKIQKIFYPKRYNEIISVYANEYNIEKNLIFAIIKAESNFNENAVSNKNALGLMQIMEDTAKDVAEKNNIKIDKDNARQEILKINNNIHIGTKYLSILIEKYQNIELALAAYNAGTGNVDNWIQNQIISKDGTDIEKVPYKETNNYVRKILQNYKIYKKLYE